MYRQVVSLQDVIGLGRNLIRRRASSVTNSENCCWSYRSPTPGSQDIRDIENISIWPPEPPSVLLHAALGLGGWPLRTSSALLALWLPIQFGQYEASIGDQRGGKERSCSIYSLGSLLGGIGLVVAAFLF